MAGALGTYVLGGTLGDDLVSGITLAAGAEIKLTRKFAGHVDAAVAVGSDGARQLIVSIAQARHPQGAALRFAAVRGSTAAAPAGAAPPAGRALVDSPPHRG